MVGLPPPLEQPPPQGETQAWRCCPLRGSVSPWLGQEPMLLPSPPLLSVGYQPWPSLDSEPCEGRASDALSFAPPPPQELAHTGIL